MILSSFRRYCVAMVDGRLAEAFPPPLPASASSRVATGSLRVLADRKVDRKQVTDVIGM